MTLTSTTNKVPYNGNGSTTEFPITFAFWDDADIKAILTVDATSVETTWVKGTNYTLTGGSGTTGTLTAITIPASGETLTIKSNLTDTQDLSLPLGGDFPSSSVEQRLDKNVRLIQQQAEELDRTPKFAESSTTTNITVPDPSADTLLGWNSAGTDLTNVTNPSANAEITAIAALTTTGLLTRTADDTWVHRLIAGTANEITLTNGDGVAANPTVSLPTALTFTGKTVTGGTFSAPIFSGTLTGTYTIGGTPTLGVTLDANNQAITNLNADSGAIDGVTIGGTTPAAGTFTALTSNGNTNLGDAAADSLTVNAGVLSRPNIPLVIAYNSAADTNVTGNNTAATIDFDTEITDQGSDFAADTYTAGTTQINSISFQINYFGNTGASDSAIVNVVTSNRTWNFDLVKANDIPTQKTLTGSLTVDMDAADTLSITLTVNGEASDVIDISGSATNPPTSIHIEQIA